MSPLLSERAMVAGRVLLVCVAIGAMGLLASLCTGCGGPPLEVYEARNEAARVVNAVDEGLEPAVETAGDEVGLTVEQRREAGEWADECRAEPQPPELEGAVDPGCVFERMLEAYDELIDEHWTTEVRNTLRAIRHYLDAMGDALAAWDAGDDGGASEFIAIAACVLAALVDVKEALVDHGVELPEQVDSVITLIGTFASSACPTPRTPEPS